MAADLIVEVGGELIAPAIELEIKEEGTFGRDEGEEGMVASPGVVGGTFEIADGREEAGRQTFCEEGADAVGLGSDDEQSFVVVQDFEGDAHEAVVNLTEDGGPVRGCMRPGELHPALRVPLSGEEGVAQSCFLGLGELGKFEMQREVADRGSCGGVVEGHGRRFFSAGKPPNTVREKREAEGRRCQLQKRGQGDSGGQEESGGKGEARARGKRGGGG